MFLSFPSTQTVSCTFMYISFFPDRLFKTESEQLIVHWILWRYVIVQSERGLYVLYIFECDSLDFVDIAQKSG